MKTSLSKPTPNGYRLAIACRCGAKFERRLTVEELFKTLAGKRLRGKPLKRRRM